MKRVRCAKPYPTSQGKIKYLLQRVMSGKGSLLAKPSKYLISMENSVLGLFDCGHISFPIVLV